MNVHFAPNTLKLLGSGAALPGSPVSNGDLLAALESLCDPRSVRQARGIVHRLGIQSRYVSRDLAAPLSGTQRTMQAPQLCHAALLQALDEARSSIGSVDYLIGHTASPHTLLPPNISWVADEFQYSGPYLELRQACTGFANGLQVAAAMIAAGGSNTIGIVGSETGSPYFDISNDFLDVEQLINYVQMGDGAGAVLLGHDDGSGEHMISDMFFGQIGVGKAPGFHIEGGGSGGALCSKGLPVFRHRAQTVREHGETLFLQGIKAITQRAHRLHEFDWILPHQANGRLADHFSRELDFPEDRVFVTADRLGNLGSAAIWVSLDMLRRSGRLEKGQRVLVLGAEASKFLFGGFIYQH